MNKIFKMKYKHLDDMKFMESIKARQIENAEKVHTPKADELQGAYILGQKAYALDIYQCDRIIKKLKALEIIKATKINMQRLIDAILSLKNEVRVNNETNRDNRGITQEEYDLLKEVLENE